MTTTIEMNPTDAFAGKAVGIFVRPNQGGATLTSYADLSNLDTTHTFLGTLLASDGSTVTFPGAPDRATIQAAVDGGVDEVATYTANTDALTIAGTFIEIRNRDLWQAATGVSFGANDYIDITGDVPDHIEVVAIAVDENGDAIAAIAPYAIGSITNGVKLAVGGTDGVPTIQASWSGDRDPVSKIKGRVFLPAGAES
jgi:hypothetical protein